MRHVHNSTALRLGLNFVEFYHNLSSLPSFLFSRFSLLPLMLTFSFSRFLFFLLSFFFFFLLFAAPLLHVEHKRPRCFARFGQVGYAKNLPEVTVSIA